MLVLVCHYDILDKVQGIYLGGLYVLRFIGGLIKSMDFMANPWI